MRNWCTALVLLIGGAAAAEHPIDKQIEEARQQLAKNRATLDEDLALLGEAEARQGPERAQLVALAQRTVAEQRQAVAQSQQRLDLLVRCRDVSLQLERDQEAAQRQQRSIEAGLRELDEWTRQNDEAQRAAVEVARKTLVHATIEKFIRGADEQLDVLEKRRGEPIRRADRWFMEELAAIRNRCNDLKLRRDALTVVKAGRGAVELWNELHETHEKAHLTSIEVLDLVRKLVGNDAALMASKQALMAAATDLEKRLVKQHFPLVEDAIHLGNFLVDYGYETTRWMESRKRILQQNQLTEEQLAAVAALGCQIERTVARLHQCRGTPPPPPSARCRVK